MVPFDLQQDAAAPDDQSPDRQNHDPGPLKRLDGLLVDSRAVTVAQHFMVRQPDLYTKLYLNQLLLDLAAPHIVYRAF